MDFGKITGMTKNVAYLVILVAQATIAYVQIFSNKESIELLRI